MKALLKVVFLMLLCASAHALRLNLVVSEVKQNLYESTSGAVIKVFNCEIPDNTPIQLTYKVYGVMDRIIYTVKEPIVVDGKIEDADIEIVCPIEWAGGIRDLGGLLIPDTPTSAVYDADSGSLHLYNIELWERLADTGQRFKYARLSFIDGAFIIQELTQ